MDLTELADEVEIISRADERYFGVTRTDDWLVLPHDTEGART